MVFHVWNRAVRRATLFSTPQDYLAFLALVVEAQAKFPMRILAYCAMPNHWHLVVWPCEAGERTKFLYWFTLTHAVRWERVHGTRGTGPVYQGRFKDSVIATGTSLYTVCAYVGCNPLVAGMVNRSEDWPWSSASEQPPAGQRPLLHEWPIPKPPADEWSRILAIRDGRTRRRVCAQAVARHAPFVSEPW